MNNNVDHKYTIKRPEEPDREFSTSQEALEYLLDNPGYAQLYHHDELLMTKGIPPDPADHDSQLFRGLPTNDE